MSTAALFNMLFGRRPMNFDDKVCYCFHISRRKLVTWVRLNEPSVPSQLSECGGAGTGCGWCIPFLKQIFRQETHRTSEREEASSASIEDLTPEEYALRRAAYIRSGNGTPPPGAEPLPRGPEI
jgi:NAD(P)H-nitrite reductase large subunit